MSLLQLLEYINISLFFYGGFNSYLSHIWNKINQLIPIQWLSIYKMHNINALIISLMQLSVPEPIFDIHTFKTFTF